MMGLLRPLPPVPLLPQAGPVGLLPPLLLFGRRRLMSGWGGEGWGVLLWPLDAMERLCVLCDRWRDQKCTLGKKEVRVRIEMRMRSIDRSSARWISKWLGGFNVVD